MSGRDFRRHTWQTVKTLDENTPFRTKLGVLIAIATACYAVGGWVKGTDTQSAANASAIAAVSTKMEALDAKVSVIADNVVALRYEVRSTFSNAPKGVANISPATLAVKGSLISPSTASVAVRSRLAR